MIAYTVLVSLRHKDGFLFERTYKSHGGENKNAQRKGLIREAGYRGRAD